MNVDFLPRPVARVATLLGFCGALVAQQAQFTPIPGTSTVPGSNPSFCGISGTAGYSGVRISGDGNVVATVVYSPGFVPDAVPRQACRWTAATGTTVVQPDLPGNYAVVGLSFDGSVIWGESWCWTAATGPIDLRPWLRNAIGQQTGLLFGCAWDGVTVVGIDGIQPADTDMVRWPQGIFGPREVLPRLGAFPEGYFYFNSVSGDGLVLGGLARRPTPSPFLSDTYAAVIVTPNGAMQLTNESSSEGVTGLSVDGSVAVGYTQVFTGASPRLRAFRWEAATGLTLLDSGVSFADASYARATNLDGTVVVGDYLVFGQPNTRAFVWTATGGFVDLRDELVNNLGLANQLAGWDLLVATDVSADGRSIVGQGIAPNGCEQAFLVRFPIVPGSVVAYGPACSSAAGPLSLTATTTPYVGSSFVASCSGIGPGSVNIAAYGLAPLAVPLPSLFSVGQPGCELLTTLDLLELVVGVGPNVAFGLAVPNDPQFVGSTIRQQLVQIELDAAGAVTALRSSNALALTFGSF